MGNRATATTMGMKMEIAAVVMATEMNRTTATTMGMKMDIALVVMATEVNRAKATAVGMQMDIAAVVMAMEMTGHNKECLFNCLFISMHCMGEFCALFGSSRAMPSNDLLTILSLFQLAFASLSFSALVTRCLLCISLFSLCALI